MSNRKFMVSRVADKYAVPLVDEAEEVQAILDVTSALHNLQESINALDEASAEREKLQECLDTNFEALEHLKNFGLTKTFLKTYNSEGEIDQLVGDVLVEYEYFDTMTKKTIDFAQESITDTLTSVGKSVWKGLVAAAKKIWEIIVMIFRRLFASSGEIAKRLRKKLEIAASNKAQYNPYAKANQLQFTPFPAAETILHFGDSVFQQSFQVGSKMMAYYKRMTSSAQSMLKECHTVEDQAKQIAKDFATINPYLNKMGFAVTMDADTFEFQIVDPKTEEKVSFSLDVKHDTPNIEKSGWNYEKYVAFLKKALKVVGGAHEKIDVFTKESNDISIKMNKLLEHAMNGNSDFGEDEATVKKNIPRLNRMMSSYTKILATMHARIGYAILSSTEPIGVQAFGKKDQPTEQ